MSLSLSSMGATRKDDDIRVAPEVVWGLCSVAEGLQDSLSNGALRYRTRKMRLLVLKKKKKNFKSRRQKHARKEN